MGTSVRSGNQADPLPFKECVVRISAKWTHKSELNIYDVDAQLFLPQ